jgi:two-component system, NarL family, invasion response regulator UvrY
MMRSEPREPSVAIVEVDKAVGVLVVDDQLIFREVAREVIAATEHFELVGEAGCGESGLTAAAALHPDLVLLDVRMPDMDGVETARRMRAVSPESVVVLISVEEDASGADTCGAAELVRKQDFGPALLRRVWQSHGH